MTADTWPCAFSTWKAKRSATLATAPAWVSSRAGFLSSRTTSDDRLLVMHERHDLRRPLIWWPTTGKTRELKIDLPGDVDAAWYPDGKALLIVHEHAGRSQLFRLDTESEELVQLPTEPGTIAGAARGPMARSGTSGATRRLRQRFARATARSSFSLRETFLRQEFAMPTCGSATSMRSWPNQSPAVARIRRSSSSMAGRKRTIATRSHRPSRRGSTTALRSYSSTTAAAPATVARGATP